MNKHSDIGRQGSAKTVVIATLAILAIAFSVSSLIRYKESTVNPRDRVQQFFKCEGCGHIFGLKLVEMYDLLNERPDDISLHEHAVLVRCSKCGDMAETTVKCRECGKHFIPDESDDISICPYCGSGDGEQQTKR